MDMLRSRGVRTDSGAQISEGQTTYGLILIGEEIEKALEILAQAAIETSAA